MTTHCPPPASGAAAMQSNDVRTPPSRRRTHRCRRRCRRRRQRRASPAARERSARVVGDDRGHRSSWGSASWSCRRTARSPAALFQAMGLMLYTAQILLLCRLRCRVQEHHAVQPEGLRVHAARDALSCGSRAQARAHMKAKILYVEPDSAGRQAQKRRVADVTGRAGINALPDPAIVRFQLRHCGRGHRELTPARSRGSMPDSAAPSSVTTSPVPNRGSTPRRHNEVAVPMRHAEGARGEC